MKKQGKKGRKKDRNVFLIVMRIFSATIMEIDLLPSMFSVEKRFVSEEMLVM